MAKKINRSEDLDFTYILRLDPELEEWRVLAAEWLKVQKRGQGDRKHVLNKFLEGYIHGLGLPKFPSEFLSTDFEAPSFLDHLSAFVNKAKYNNYMLEFLDWVLETHFSAEDDAGRKTIAPGFANPLTRANKAGGDVETNKAALPHRYLRELREILCPPDARSFSDWRWAIDNAFGGTSGGDWFEVDPDLIDRDDPDCVWRERTVPIRAYQDISLKSKGSHVVGERKVIEMWSPTRWVALYVKLELPLRTSQVRWLDSGEADTWGYQGGEWVANPSPLARGSVKRPYQRGVFRRSPDPDTGGDKTALFINTNKTADIDKAEDAKGYVVPWAHPRALPWLERLRDWQAKYNPITAPVPWTALGTKHLKNIKHPEILEEMGDVCFLFRAAHARGKEDRDKPVNDEDLKYAWHRLLSELEKRTVARNDGQGRKLVFITHGSRRGTEFPLHSLRVSLITAYAIEGDVPIAILSKCIAGHARIIMTLYYTKAGIGRVTEVMDEAERKMAAKEKESFETFLADATYRQIEQAAAFNDPAAIQAIMDNRSRAGWVVDEKGICPLGCSACDKGYKLLRQGKEKEKIAPVPGYPREKNCVRCRFFLSGPAFLPGLQDHFNWVSGQLSDAAVRYVELQQKVEGLQEEMMECTESGAPFARRAEYERLSRHYEAEADKLNKLGDDLNATVKLVKRSIAILMSNPLAGDAGKLSLVPVGDMQDIGFALADVSEAHQLEVLCENAIFYPETDASKAVLRRSQIIDGCLEMNGRAPVFFRLSPDLQHRIGNEFMRLLTVKQGSLKGAVDVVEGIKSLEEIGLLEQATDLIEHRTGQSLLPNGTIYIEQLPTGTGGD